MNAMQCSSSGPIPKLRHNTSTQLESVIRPSSTMSTPNGKEYSTTLENRLP